MLPKVTRKNGQQLCEKLSTSLTTNDIKIKTTTRQNLTVIGMATIKRTIYECSRGYEENGTLVQCVSE
jgi:hypothetical protein